LWLRRAAGVVPLDRPRWHRAKIAIRDAVGVETNCAS